MIHKKTKEIVGLLIILLLISISVNASELNNSDIIKDIISMVEVNELEGAIDKYSKFGFEKIVEDYNPKGIVLKIITGKIDFTAGSILNNIFKLLFNEVYVNINILIKIIVLTLLCSLLQNLKNSFVSDTVSKLSFFACYIVIVSILLVSFNETFLLAKSVISNMMAFLNLTIPIMIIFLLMGGNILSSSVYKSVILGSINISSNVLSNIVMPFIFTSMLLFLIDGVCDDSRISKLSKFFKYICGWILGIILTVQISILTFQSTLVTVSEGVAGKTLKFAIGAFVPIVGKYLVDAADAVLSSSIIIKNAVGLVIMLGILAICVVPLIKILALILLYKVCAVIIEPISPRRLSDILNEMSSSLVFIFGVIVAVAIMFLISVAIILNTLTVKM